MGAETKEGAQRGEAFSLGARTEPPLRPEFVNVSWSDLVEHGVAPVVSVRADLFGKSAVLPQSSWR
jgi:hypothetical protein